MSQESILAAVPVIPSKVLNKVWIFVRANKEPSNKVPEAKRRKIEEKKDKKTIEKEEDDILHESEEDLEEYDYDNFSTTVGKWMLFLDIKHESEAKGMTDHDYAWQSIKRLVETRGQQVGLIAAKCSTGWRQTTDNPKGLICCYTSNFNDKSQVKKAGDAIREVVSYQSEMYYKTDNDTFAGKYTKNGNKCVSIYKHSRDSKMFERDELVPYQWNKVDV